MNNTRGFSSSLDEDYWEVSHAAARLTAFACTISARHLSYGVTRMQFNRELAYYAKRVVDDVEARRLSPEEGLKALKSEQVSLLDQSGKLTQQVVGLVGGLGQVATGVGACVQRRMLCTFFGGPVLAHGLNNSYENAKNIQTQRNDEVGPVRKGYQRIAAKLGYSEREGNLFYYATDVGLSGYGLFFRKELKPGAWRLYKYHDIDRARVFRLMKHHTLFFEGVVNGLTLSQLIKEYLRK